MKKCPKCGYEFGEDNNIIRCFRENWGRDILNPAEKRYTEELAGQFGFDKVFKAFEIAALQNNMKLAYVVGILKKQAEQEYKERVKVKDREDMKRLEDEKKEMEKATIEAGKMIESIIISVDPGNGEKKGLGLMESFKMFEEERKKK